MKFLKTHTGAMVVLAVVIVLSVLLGSHRSLVQAREKVEAQFAPIAGDLQDCLDITANLLTVAGRYLDEGELGELTDSRAALAESGGITCLLYTSPRPTRRMSACWGTRRPSFSSWRTAS